MPGAGPSRRGSRAADRRRRRGHARGDRGHSRGVRPVRRPPDAAAARGRGRRSRRSYFPQGERILRQGLTGYRVLRDPRRQRGRHASTATKRADARPRRLLRRGVDPARRAADRRHRRRRRRCAASRSPARPRSSRSSSRIRGSCTGCSRPRPAASATRTAGGARAVASPASDDRPFPPGEYPVIVIGSGPGGLQVSYGLQHYGIAARRPLRRSRRRAACSAAGRSSSGCCRGPSPTRPRPRTSREYQRYDWNSLARLRARAAVDPDRAHGRLVVLPVAAGDGGATSRRSRSAPGSPSATSAGGSARAATTARTARCSCSRPRTASTAAGCSCSRSASPSRGARRRPASSTPATTRDTRDASCVRRQAAVHHRQAELGLRARVGPGVLGLGDHGLLAVARQDVDPDEVAGRRPGPLRAAVRGQLPRARGVTILDASIDGDRARRTTASGSTSSGPTTARR